MRVFKFGGASIKDADGVKNVAKVLQKEGTKNTLVVISAMGKMTNAFENIVNAYCNNSEELKSSIDFVYNFHVNIVENIFKEPNKILQEITILMGKLSGFLTQNKSKDYNYIYDQIVSFGELLSTKIVSFYLQEIGVKNTWLDIRNIIKTDSFYREAKVNWKETNTNIQEKIDWFVLNITQGFLGSDTKGKTTTLGREGSDYTAGILAYSLNAKSLTIWKDVNGVLNADPRVFSDTVLLEQISYEEAIEMAFYGASVIHPKTIKPLQNKEIPLYVRSFINTDVKGTKVSKGVNLLPLTPCFIVKKNQILVSIASKDFSFMVESNISYIFKKLHQYKLKVNLIQNSAISFSVCVDNKFNNFDAFYNDIKLQYKLDSYKGVDLYTIRHFTNDSVNSINKKGKSLLTQINKETIQIVIKNT